MNQVKHLDTYVKPQVDTSVNHLDTSMNRQETSMKHLDTYVKPQPPQNLQPSYITQLRELYKETSQEESIPLVPQSIDLIGGEKMEEE